MEVSTRELCGAIPHPAHQRPTFTTTDPPVPQPCNPQVFRFLRPIIKQVLANVREPGLRPMEFVASATATTYSGPCCQRILRRKDKMPSPRIYKNVRSRFFSVMKRDAITRHASHKRRHKYPFNSTYVFMAFFCSRGKIENAVAAPRGRRVRARSSRCRLARTLEGLVRRARVKRVRLFRRIDKGTSDRHRPLTHFEPPQTSRY